MLTMEEIELIKCSLYGNGVYRHLPHPEGIMEKLHKLIALWNFDKRQIVLNAGLSYDTFYTGGNLSRELIETDLQRTLSKQLTPYMIRCTEHRSNSEIHEYASICVKVPKISCTD